MDVATVRKVKTSRRMNAENADLNVRLSDGTIRLAEVHWFEAHGIGKRKMRIKRFLD